MLSAIVKVAVSVAANLAAADLELVQRRVSTQEEQAVHEVVVPPWAILPFPVVAAGGDADGGH